ncbi:hydroxyisourate hydrolase [Arthrobacter sp. MDB2-24]|jgi:5-hydroxyisourate hydrolase
MTISHVTTHVLDTGTGLPATGITASLASRTDDGWSVIATGTTDSDGRIRAFGPERLTTGTYRIEFDTGTYFAGAGVESFFPEVALIFRLDASTEHYHVPLLLSPFAYSTYRGS